MDKSREGGRAMSSGSAVASRPRNTTTTDLTSLKDDQLLSLFFKEREEAAFGAIVERHGPLVYGVCRRILPDSNDAEAAIESSRAVAVETGEARTGNVGGPHRRGVYTPRRRRGAARSAFRHDAGRDVGRRGI